MSRTRFFFTVAVFSILGQGLARAAEVEKTEPRLGDYRLEATGVDVALYAEVAAIYGADMKPEIAQRLRRGDKMTMALEKGDVKGYEVYVPKDYQKDEPYGVISFVNSADSGGVPDGGWKAILDKYRLIWIGGNGIGNECDVPYRHAKSLDAVRKIAAEYTIDPDRVYITGTSGGGRVASQVMVANPSVFSGAFPIVGCNNYRQMLKRLPPQSLAAFKSHTRCVFVTGEGDMNRDETKKLSETYLREGVSGVQCFDIPGLGHNTPKTDWFEKIIVALDAPLKASAKTQYDTAVKAEKTKRLAAAIEGFLRASAHGRDEDFADDAKERFTALRSQYAEELEKIETAASDGKLNDASKALAEFRKRWAAYGATDAARITDVLQKARKTKPTVRPAKSEAQND